MTNFIGVDSGQTYPIVEELGRGGQGVVYRVNGGGHASCAAKWYLATHDADQREQIANLVRHGAPKTGDTGIGFIWPIELLTLENTQGFGYLMPLIETQRFHSHHRISSRKISQPKLPVLCRISYRIAHALDIIHAAGSAYCDINVGNIMLDPVSGDIVICDNDNVVINNSDTPIKGVWEFMAPEVALGDSRPNAESDLYSLAILLYYLWMWEHPMEGRETLEVYSWDIPAKKKYYAREPVFVFHPTEPRNTARGVPDLQLHVERWDRMCPPRLQQVFTQVFTEGVSRPDRRQRLMDWQRLFLELEANALTCGCGAINVWDSSTQPLLCWKCRKPIPLRLVLRVKHGHSADSLLLARPDAELRRHHLDVSRFGHEAGEVVGRVEPHPKEAGHVILRNLSTETWHYQMNGQLLPMTPQQARALMPGVELTVANRSMVVETV